MAHLFSNSVSSRTFKSNRPVITGGDYIANRRLAATHTSMAKNPTIIGNTSCAEHATVPARRITHSYMNTGNLNYSLFSRVDLAGVCVVRGNVAPYECPVAIDPSVNINTTYTVDPDSVLFDDSMCESVQPYMTFIVPS